MAQRTDYVTPPVDIPSPALVGSEPFLSIHGNALAAAEAFGADMPGHEGCFSGQITYSGKNVSDGPQPSESAQSGQTTVSDAGSSIIPITPVEITANKRPMSPGEYFTAAGRPARSASLKKVRYAIDWDKKGNPIKSKEEKAAEKDKRRQDKEQEKRRKSEENAARRSSSATGSKNSAEPQNASGEPSSSRSLSASASTPGYVSRSTSDPVGTKPVETTRSGRQVTAPIDRHRSAAREAKSSARRRQLQEMQFRNEQEDEEEAESESEEGEASDSDLLKVPQALPVQKEKDESRNDAVSIHTGDDDRDEMDLLEMSDEEDAVPTSAASKAGKNSSLATSTKQDAARKADNRPARTWSPNHHSAAQDGSRRLSPPQVMTTTSGSETPVETPCHKAKFPAHKAPGQKPAESPLADTSSQHESLEKNSSSETVPPPSELPITSAQLGAPAVSVPACRPSKPVNPPLSVARAVHDKDAARKAFSGKALSSLLSSASHRRPGLGNRSSIPPLHPNRQPAPPPKMAPPMSRKDKEALKKEQRAREENGSDEDDSDDSNGEEKPKYNPFEEEIEGY